MTDVQKLGLLFVVCMVILVASYFLDKHRRNKGISAAMVDYFCNLIIADLKRGRKTTTYQLTVQTAPTVAEVMRRKGFKTFHDPEKSILIIGKDTRSIEVSIRRDVAL